MVNKVLKWILLFSPIAYTTGIQLNKFDITFFKLGVITLFIASLFDKQVRELSKEIVYTIVSLMALCFIGLYVHKFSIVILSAYINLSFAIVLLTILIRYVTDVKQFYKYIIIAGAINIVLFTLQRFGIDLIFNSNITPGFEGGLIGNGPRLIIYLTLILPIMFSKNILLSIPIIAVGLIMREYSFLPIIPLVVFYKLSKLVHKKILIPVFSIMCVLIVCLFYKEISTPIYHRFVIWSYSLKLLLQYPSMGYGLGSFPVVITGYMEKVNLSFPFMSAYNDYLEFLVGVGLLGVGWLVYVSKIIIRYFKFNLQTIILFSMLILMSFEYPLEIPRLWFTIVFIIASFIIVNYQERRI